MEKLNFSIFGFLSDRDKKTIYFLYKDLNRNFKHYQNEPFANLFKYLFNRFGNTFSLYEIYKFLYILKYNYENLIDDYVWRESYYNNEEQYILLRSYNLYEISNFILHNDKFISQINDLRFSFFNGCGIDIFNFKPNPSMDGLRSSFETQCHDDDNDEVYSNSGYFYVSFKFIDNSTMEFRFDLFRESDIKIIIPHPWGDFKNITIDGMIELFTKTIVPYYKQFFSNYLGRNHKRYVINFVQKN
jgi:hypothetical protein